MNFLSRFKAETLPTGTGERCPYCAGYHYTRAEFEACADQHSPRDVTYTCDYCGRHHQTQGAADRCCDEYKRRARYHSENRNTSPFGHTEDNRHNTSGSLLDAFLNAGSNSNDNRSSNNDGGIFDRFFGAGENNDDHNNNGNGGSFFGW